MTTVTVTLGSSVNPSVYGETITFSVGVVSDDIPNFPGPPTGTVELFDGLTSLGTQPLDGAGNCSFLISSLDVLNSPHDIYAQYSGDGTFTGNSSNHISQVVNQDTTTTALVSSLNPSSFGDMVTFTATVTADAPGSGTPTGTVTFFDGVAPLATRSLVAGVASLAISSLTVPASPHDINATYNGDDNFSTSDSNHVSQVVTLAATTLSIDIPSGASPPSLNPSTPVVDPGANCEFTVTVTGGPAASGTIALDLDGVAFGGSNPVLSGTADFFAVIPAHALTPATITAHYSGDAGHAASTVALTVDIGHRTYVTFGFTGTSESSGLTQVHTVVEGTVVVVTAQIRDTSIIAPFNIVHSGPTTGVVGILTFKEGSTVLGTGILDSATANASIPLNLPVGTHTIDAFFTGYAPTFLWASDSQHWTSGAEVNYLSGTVIVTPSSGGGGPPPPPPPPPPGPPPPPAPPALRLCPDKIDCPGTDSPFLNLSSEALDFPGFFSLYYGRYDPPLGTQFFADSCIGVAESTVSQEVADLEAALESLLCTVDSWHMPTPPILPLPPQQIPPPGTFGNTPQTATITCPNDQVIAFTVPANTYIAATQFDADQIALEFAEAYALAQATATPGCFGGGGGGPQGGGTPPQVYVNSPTSCDAVCPDGNAFVFAVPRGRFAALNQIQADNMAYSYACRQAQLAHICLSALNPAACCVGATNVVVVITATGVSSSPVNLWEIVAGAVPPGMTFHGGFLGSTTIIDGTPTTAGNYSFTVRVTAQNGDFMQKIYQFCVTEVLPATMPDATLNSPYSQALTLNCGTALTWYLASGSLPPGMTIDTATGVISGTPTTIGAFTFTVNAQIP